MLRERLRFPRELQRNVISSYIDFCLSFSAKLYELSTGGGQKMTKNKIVWKTAYVCLLEGKG